MSINELKIQECVLKATDINIHLGGCTIAEMIANLMCDYARTINENLDTFELANDVDKQISKLIELFDDMNDEERRLMISKLIKSINFKNLRSQIIYNDVLKIILKIDFI